MFQLQSSLRFPSDQDASGRTLGVEELDNLRRAIESGTLTSTKGTFVKSFEHAFAERLGIAHAYACSSGSAAIHCAIAAIDPEPGDEIITTAITDMGAITPILFQSAIPRFADVDPITCNVTAETIARVLSPKTKAIIVTHLFGVPAEMNAIVALANRLGIPVIEDAAQALLAQDHGRYTGTIGAIGCFSLQQGKHITTGEGGIVVTNDPALARRIALFINKAWPYGESNPDHEFIALNYRMSELQGAVALAQLGKLDDVVAKRDELAARLTARIATIAGISVPQIPPHARSAWWKYAVRVDAAIVPGGSPAVGKGLLERGIASAPRYIVKPAFECRIFREQNTFGSSHWPFTLATPEAVDYARARFPGTYDGLEAVLVLAWNDKYTSEHIEAIAQALESAVESARGVLA